MLGFMDYVQNAFYDVTGWNKDNSYGALTATSRNILEFEPPNGLRLHVSSLPSRNFASSYTLGSIGLVDGSLSYLYTSHTLEDLISHSSSIPLRQLVPGYRQIPDFDAPDDPDWWEIWLRGRRIDTRSALLYGRLFLPRSTLEALYMRRITPRSQVKVSCVSDSRLPNGGTMLAHLQYDAAKYSTEYIYSTDSALLGIRGLYNFGPDPLSSIPPNTPANEEPIEAANIAIAAVAAEQASGSLTTKPRPNGRLSAGGEIYYGILNKSGGASAGLRFTTLPSHSGFPYTMTVTINPLMGNLSSTYSVLASPLLTLSSRFDFNVYSYESELQIGTELWRKKAKNLQPSSDVNWARIKMGLPIIPPPRVNDKDDHADNNLSGCLKARLDQRGGLALLWTGRVKELLYSCGTTVNLKGGENMFTGVGLELQYSS